MKFFLILVIFLTFGTVKTILLDFKYNALKAAFANIIQSLAKQNRLVSAVVVSDSSEKVNSAIIASIADVPHVVASFDNKLKQILLNSSAFVSLDSVESLKKFNQRTILPVTFSN